MRSRKQPKVHKYSRKRRRTASPARTAFSIVFTFIVAGAIGVVGYSIAKPILQYTGDNIRQESTVETSPPVETVLVATSTTESTETTTEVSTLPEKSDTSSAGIRLPESALKDAQALSQALESAKQLCPTGTILIVPVKVQGGAILYQTDVSLAQQCGAVQGSLKLEEISAAISEQGWIPVAECSLLYDNLLPNVDAQAGYMTTDGSRWLDNKKENGGKAWVSPFSSVTQQYLTEITQEIAASGFSQIWYKDAVFPPFRDSDLTYIGETVQQSDRGKVLVQLVNLLSEAAGEKPALLEVDAIETIAGNTEIFEPGQLKISGIVLCLGTEMEQAETTLQWVSSALPEQEIWIMADSMGVSEEMDVLQTATEKYSAAGWILSQKES